MLVCENSGDLLHEFALAMKYEIGSGKFPRNHAIEFRRACAEGRREIGQDAIDADGPQNLSRGYIGAIFLKMKRNRKRIVVAFIGITLSIFSAILVKDWIRESLSPGSLGPLGVDFFIIAYALATVLFLPGCIFIVSAGSFMVVVGGTLVALSGAIIGATPAFLVAPAPGKY